MADAFLKLGAIYPYYLYYIQYYGYVDNYLHRSYNSSVIVSGFLIIRFIYAFTAFSVLSLIFTSCHFLLFCNNFFAIWNNRSHMFTKANKCEVIVKIRSHLNSPNIMFTIVQVIYWIWNTHSNTVKMRVLLKPLLKGNFGISLLLNI